ncbi:MAG: glycine cleavage system protein GcvH [Dehalococcoidia bacterium]
MMEIPAELRYTTEDEWLRLEPDGTATVGITAYAQDQLGDIVFVELPEIGRVIARGEAFGVVESVKAVSDLFMPASGEVLARNDALVDASQLINESPYDDGWIIRIRPTNPAEIDALLTADAYRSRLPAE